MSGSVQKTFFSVSGVLLLAGILLLVNSIGRVAFSSLYVDLTDEGLYSLSDGTKNIVSTVEDPIKFRFYLSRANLARHTGIALYGERILELLKEYSRVGKGKILLETYDPKQDSEEEEWAQKYGLTPMPIPNGEMFYLGLAATTASGKEAAIPMFDFNRQGFLEYDITSLIASLVETSKPVVGVLSELPIKGGAPTPPTMPGMPPQGGASQPWFFTTQLSELAEVRHLETSVSDISKDIDVLMVVHPKALSDETLFAIDQYVMQGGKLFVAVDPYSQVDRPQASAQMPQMPPPGGQASNLSKLLSSWGVEMLESKAVADINLATPVNAGRGGPNTSFVLWLSLNSKSMNESDVVTGALEELVFPVSGILELKDVEGVNGEVLLKTTKDAMVVEQNDYRLGGGNPDSLLRSYRKGSEEKAVAVRLTGSFKSNFPEGRPKSDEEKKDSLESELHLTESSKPTSVVVVSDVDFMSDIFSVAMQNFFGRKVVSLRNDNLVFLQNTLEQLMGSTDLIGIRSRGKFTRPFGKVQELEHQAQLKWQNEEQSLQAKLNGVNDRLRQLQSAQGSAESGKQVFSKGMLEELGKFRKQRQVAQRRLREVRRNLRQDIHKLGNVLFLMNAFLVPALLIFIAIAVFVVKRRNRRTN